MVHGVQLMNLKNAHVTGAVNHYLLLYIRHFEYNIFLSRLCVIIYGESNKLCIRYNITNKYDSVKIPRNVDMQYVVQ